LIFCCPISRPNTVNSHEKAGGDPRPNPNRDRKSGLTQRIRAVPLEKQ